jgi:hypothetical protein
MSTNPWFFRNGTNVIGPVSAEVLRQFARSGHITPDTEVSRDGQKWISATELRGLSLAPKASVVSGLPAAAPPPVEFQPAEEGSAAASSDAPEEHAETGDAKTSSARHWITYAIFFACLFGIRSCQESNNRMSAKLSAARRFLMGSANYEFHCSDLQQKNKLQILSKPPLESPDDLKISGQLLLSNGSVVFVNGEFDPDSIIDQSLRPTHAHRTFTWAPREFELMRPQLDSVSFRCEFTSSDGSTRSGTIIIIDAENDPYRRLNQTSDRLSQSGATGSPGDRSSPTRPASLNRLARKPIASKNGPRLVSVEWTITDEGPQQRLLLLRE